MNRTLLTLITLTLMITLFVGCERDGFDPLSGDPVVARVGDAVLTRHRASQMQLEAYGATMRFPPLEKVVSDWIDQQLIYQQALRTGLDKEPELSWALERFAIQLLGKELLKREVYDRMPALTESDIMAYYEENRDTYRARGPMVWLWIIERDDELSARRLVNDRLAPDGSNFRAEAKVWSLGVAQPQGGDRGYINHTRTRPEIWEVATQLPLNTVSDVIPYEMGDQTKYAVILVADRVEEGDYLDPEGLGRERLEDRAFSRQTRLHTERYLDRLRDEINVFIDYNLIADIEAWSRQAKEAIEDPTPLLRDQ